MTTLRNMALGPELLLAAVLLASPAAAQQPEDDLLPAVDTSAPDFSVGESGNQAIDPQQQGAESPPVAAGVTRSTVGNLVMDTIELGRTEITGNQELPKVMYIVPWQKSDPGDLIGKPVNSLLDEVLAPIDREEFMRQVDYYGDLYSSEDE